ncbi:MAG: leucyl aminopeptidase [Bacteroidota bacterium]|nr:leucyl aminopeptidase [Bacteroidota bacterium]
MALIISSSKQVPENETRVILCQSLDSLNACSFNQKELKYIQDCHNNKQELIAINRYGYFVFVQWLDDNPEACRQQAKQLHQSIVNHHIQTLYIIDTVDKAYLTVAFAESVALCNYQFLKYISDKKPHSLGHISLVSKLTQNEVELLDATVKGTCIAKNLVNEPLSYLTAMQYSEDIKALGLEAGFEVEVLHKKKIESLKMGGLLAVNQGSIDPPTFNILEWKGPSPVNDHPIVLVGKGIVYDTGGLSLKPTANSMDLMKSDMGGSAAVVGTLYAIAKAKLNVHVIGLVPATDNRPSGNAYAPGDVIHMFDGTTVEVMNTDAEGRLILADALSFAKRYDPKLVIDVATLTGSAARAIGKQGIVAMGNDKQSMAALKESGLRVHERIAELPFWDQYKEDLKSPIADLKNIGGPEAGAITAGKFLEHFTDYPYTHLDIAGMAFMTSPFSYHGKGATGVGVRLLVDFLYSKCQ